MWLGMARPGEAGLGLARQARQTLNTAAMEITEKGETGMRGSHDDG